MLEAVMIFTGAVSLLSLVTLRQDLGGAAGANPPRPAVAATARFARDPAEYRPVQLTLIPGGKEDTP